MIGIDWAGIDGNRHPDLKLARAAGVGFGIRKAFQYPYGADAGLVEDWNAMKAAGIVRGIYVFPDVHPNAASPATQVRMAANALALAGGLEPGDLPPALDVEFPGGKLPRAIADVVSFLEEFATAMRDAFGCWPLLYTSERVWDGSDTDALRSPASWLPTKCPLWVKTGYLHAARTHITLGTPQGRPRIPKAWGSLPSPGEWINQWDGDQIGLPGFSSTVDVNRMLPLDATANYLDAARVAWVQRILGVEATARMDDVTIAAIKAFQERAGLDADGVIGIRTFALLARANAT